MQKKKKKKLKPVKNSSPVCFADSEELRAEYKDEDTGKEKPLKTGEEDIDVKCKK